MTPEHIKNAFAERQNAVNELRALADSAEGREFSAEEAATEVRLNEAINDLDARINGGLENLEREARAADARARFESVAPTGSTVAESRKVETERDAIFAMARGERRSVDIALPGAYEARDLTRGTATDGAELVESSLYGQIYTHLVDESAFLSAGPTVLRTADGNDIVFPKSTSYSSAALVAEGGSIGESDPQFTTVTIGAYKLAFLVQVSSELLDDASFDVAAYLAAQGGAALGRGADTYFVTGSGSGQPNGVDNCTVGKTLASTSAVTMDELIDVQHAVVPQARKDSVWMFNDDTLALVRKLKDGNNNYLWQPSNQAGAPDRLMGNAVYSEPNIAALDGTANAIVGVFGDPRGYYARFAGGVRVERSDDFAFANDLVTFKFIVRIDGDIVGAERLRSIKAAAS